MPQTNMNLSTDIMMGIINKMNINLTVDEAKKMISEVEHISVSKGEFVAREGDTLKSVCFIAKGLTRGYYIDVQGNEVTRCFSSEGDFICSEGLMKSTTASYYIQALENMSGVLIPYHTLKELVKSNKSVSDKFNEYCLSAYMIFDDRQHSLLTKSASERYIDFLHKYSLIEKRIKQEYIASYIGIQPSSLSRLKKAIKN